MGGLLEVTRREFARITGAAVVARLANAQKELNVSNRAQEMARQEGLAIIEGGLGIFGGDGARIGRLLPQGGSRFPPCVSPDGEHVAWYPPFLAYPSLHYQQKVVISDGRGNVKMLDLDGVGGALAISSGGLSVAAVLAKSERFRLAYVNAVTGEERDVSSQVGKLDLNGLQRLRLSGDGNRLVAASEEYFCLVDLPSKNTLVSGRGRYPSISPDGSNIAFVVDHIVNLKKSVGDGSSHAIQLDLRIEFTGAWSPNGQFLLVGGLKTFPSDYRLIVVDVVAQKSWEVAAQVDEIHPDISWIKERFASVIPKKQRKEGASYPFPSSH